MKTGWAETDKGQPGKPDVRARWVAKEYKKNARPVLYASTPPLEALEVMLSEVATGKRGGKFVALVDVRRAYCHAPSRKRVFVELPPEHYQAGDEHMCGLLQYSFYGTRDAAQKWEEQLASTLSDLNLASRIACPCVWPGCTRGEQTVATVHGDDITFVEGDRQWNSSSKWFQENTRSSKQVIGEDADLDKIGRILNRVIKWVALASQSRRIRDMSGRYREILSWNERITLRLHAPWKGRVRAMQEVTKARERTDANRDNAKPNTIGMMRVTVTTRTECR